MATSVQDFLRQNPAYIGRSNTANRSAPVKGKKGSGNQSWLFSIISELGGAGGALGGAATGAALGSVVPGIGNIVGGIAGGIVGGFGGGFGGRAIENKVRDDEFRLGDALKEGAVSGAFGAIGPAWQGARGLSALGKGVGGKGIGAGIEALGGFGDDAAKVAAGKAISRGGKKAAQSALFGGEKLNALQVAGRGMAGNAGGVGVGSKAPGLENLGPGAQDEILAALKKVGLSRSNPEKTLRGLEPVLSTKGANIAKAYASSTRKFTVQELNNTADDILKTIIDDPSIELSKSAQNQLLRKLGILVKKDSPEAMWNFQKDMGNAINFGKGVEAKLVDREAIARVIRSKTSSLLDDAVKEVAGDRKLYHTLKDADKLMRVSSKQADKSGIVARVGTSAPFRSAESKLGGALEAVGNKAANRVVGQGARVGRGMATRGVANRFMQPVVQDPTQEDTTLYGPEALQGGMDGGLQQGFQNETPQPQQSAYPLEQAIADFKANSGNAKVQDQIMQYYNFVSKAEKDQGGGTLTAQEKKAQKQAATALQGLNQLKSLYGGAGGGQNRLPGILSNVQGLVGGNSKAEAYNRIRDSLTTALARAFGETGVLTDQDREVYKQALPRLQDTPEEAAIKLQYLEDMLAESSAGYGTAPEPDLSSLIQQGVY